MEIVDEHPPLLPVTVYVMLSRGEAVTLLPVHALSQVHGDHE